MSYSPLLSIITPSLNRAEFIEEAIQSVLDQDYPNVEHIIVDGGSTDGTLEVLKRYPHLKVISEPDKGIYDALNKGIKISHGEVIGFLNTDDFYEPNIFGSIVDNLNASPRSQAIVGATRIHFKRKNKNQFHYYPTILPDDLIQRITIGVSNFNAWFFRKSVIDRVGSFNISFMYSADREFLIRFALKKIQYLPVDRVFYNYLQHDGSLTITSSYDKASPFICENRMIAENFMTDPKLTLEERRPFLTWHSDITAGQMVSTLRKGDLTGAYRYLTYGWRHNPLWPIVLFYKIIRRLNYWESKKY